MAAGAVQTVLAAIWASVHVHYGQAALASPVACHLRSFAASREALGEYQPVQCRATAVGDPGEQTYRAAACNVTGASATRHAALLDLGG